MKAIFSNRTGFPIGTTPWRIEDELKKLGANYIQAGLWRGFAVRDGNLIIEP
jgi:putative intracellular protease/amidase